mgnify:CR=1 FL=1
MKKNSFIEGTIIATICIVIVKILGMFYVIPFYAIVGSTGAALYAYAYNLYGLFLEIATAGIPNAVSKIINEYNTLNKQEAKIRTFQIGKRLLSLIAVFAFIIMFVFAPQLSELIIGDLTGGNTIEDVTFVIRCVSFALLVFPFLSVTRGFFQGHNIISVSSVSQVIEQLARVLVIIIGSYIALKWLHLDLTTAVGVAVFGAFVGGLCALLYVRGKLKQNKKALALDEKFEVRDEVTNKEIIKKIIKYAIPIVIVSIAFTIYNNVDMILVLRTMNYLGLDADEVEFIATGISTWAPKISIVITSIVLGLSASLIPNMVEAFTLKKYGEVNHKFNKSLQIILFISLPMCVGISLLSAAIWTVFYGYSNLGTSILTVAIFAPLFSNLYTVCNHTLQSMNKFKWVYISSITGIVLNAVLDVPFMLLFDFLGLPAYWGATLATVVGFSATVVIAMIYLRREYHFQYTDTKKMIGKILIPLIVMIVVVVLMKLFIPVDYDSRFACIMYIAVISAVGALSYFIVSHKMGLMDEILGENYLQKLKKRFLKNKKEV